MQEHILSGCKSKPLASYLKAVGVLRLVAEQKDQTVKALWRSGSFVIHTQLSSEELIAFFCDEYAPSPIISPWNGGSGFYPNDNKEALKAILKTQSDRFGSYRKVISEVQSWAEITGGPANVREIIDLLNGEIGETRSDKKRDELKVLLNQVLKCPPVSSMADKDSLLPLRLNEVESLSKDKKHPDQKAISAWWKIVKKARNKCGASDRGSNKDLIMARCRAKLPDVCLQWLDAAYVMHGNGDISYNPVLGTGGNEGRLDLGNNFMQRTVELFAGGDPYLTKDLLGSALFSTTARDLPTGSFGQTDPGRAGGFNQGMEIETKDFKINPWDFVLMMEGSLILAGAAVRRNPSDTSSRLSIPFTVRFSPVGFTSCEYTEQGRRETWLPIWPKPATDGEIKFLFSEGRCVVGRKVAGTGLEFSRAVGTLGVDRGISSFERYAFLKRRGDSYVALPAGSIPVHYRPGIELLNELDPVLKNLDKFLDEIKKKFKKVPAAYETARRQIDDTLFALCQKSDAVHFCELVRALGRMEQILAARDRSKKPALARPLLGLSPRWAVQCDDGNIEWRIAAALSSIRATGKIGSIRSNMAGTSPEVPWRWAEGHNQQCWYGSDLFERLGKVLERRIVDGQRMNAPILPLQAYVALSPHDVAPFLAGDCEEKKVEELLWGFSLVDWRKPGRKMLQNRLNQPVGLNVLSRTWALLKLLHVPGDIRGVKVRYEPRIVSLLRSGRFREACDVATRRLRISELKPYDVVYEEELSPVRLLASLLIPVGEQWRLESLVLADSRLTAS